MKSIRVSLIVYFLLLLAVALGAVSYFYYESTSQALRDKEATKKKLLDEQYHAACVAVRADLDQKLQRSAEALAGQACGYRRGWEHAYPADLIALAANPSTRLAAGLWVPEVRSADGPNSFPNMANAKRVLSRTPPHHPIVHLEDAEDVIDKVRDLKTQVFFQSFTKDGWTMEKSESLGTDSFVLDDKVRHELSLFKEKFDDVTLKSGLKLRRVTYKVPVPRFNFTYAPGTIPQAPPQRVGWLSRYMPKGGPPKGGPPPKGEDRRPPFAKGSRSLTIFIQYASDVDKRDRNIAALRAERDQALADLAEQSREALVTLQQYMLWVGLTTFAALFLGGYLLVWLGLLPLHRLSDAVSRVSARDFRLEIDDRKMPGELQPIVERLKHTLELLKRAFAREKQAAADISHELRTPLAALMTTLEVGLRKSRSAEEYREMLEDCRESGLQMNQLVERLLKLARLDAGADLVRPREVDVAALADQCATLVRPLVEARGLTLRVHHDGPALLMADPDKLREVVTNLLHNAIQYNRPDGAIDIAVGSRDGELRIEVRDTGVGISAEARQRIFERFYREDPSRHAEGLHAGLGLAIVKGYVDLMGGGIEVESQVGAGTTFRVCLPVRPAVTRSVTLTGANPAFAIQPAQPGV